MVVAYWMLVMANASAFGTLLLGWYVVPFVGLIGAWWAPRASRPLISVPVGLALGWGVLLVRSARSDGFPALAEILEALLPVRPAALASASLGLVFLLGLGAALVGVALRRPVATGS